MSCVSNKVNSGMACQRCHRDMCRMARVTLMSSHKELLATAPKEVADDLQATSDSVKS